MKWNLWKDAHEREMFFMGLGLFLVVSFFLVITSIEHAEHREEIKRKSLEYSALYDTFGEELERTTEQNKQIEQQAAEIATMQRNMARLAALQPILPFVEPQEALTLIKELPISSPFDSPFKVTSRYGEGPGHGGAYRTTHQGTDLVPEGNWQIHPMWAGTVTEIGISHIFGKFIVIQHSDTIRTRYHHLSKIFNTALP